MNAKIVKKYSCDMGKNKSTKRKSMRIQQTFVEITAMETQVCRYYMFAQSHKPKIKQTKTKGRLPNEKI